MGVINDQLITPFKLTQMPSANYLKLTCKNCGKEFDRRQEKENFRLKRGADGPFCSRSCSALFLHRHKQTHGRAILTEQDVRAFREMYANGATVPEIIQRSGMSDTAIRSLLKGRTWKDIK